MPAAMTSRARIPAALRRQPVDRLPFVPLLDHYTLKGMPSHFPLAVTEAALVARLSEGKDRLGMPAGMNPLMQGRLKTQGNVGPASGFADCFVQ